MTRPSYNTPLLKDLVALRYRRGLTQREVAERMNVTTNAVSMIENGRRGGNIATITAYAAAVGAELTMRELTFDPIPDRWSA